MSGGSLYSYWHEGELSIKAREIGGPDRLDYTKLDAGRNLHAYWTGDVAVPGGTVTGAYQQCLSQDLTWQAQEVVSGRNAVSMTPLGATDRAGHFVMVWKEGDGSVRLGWWIGCTPSVRMVIPMPAGVSIRALSVKGNPDTFCFLEHGSDDDMYTSMCASSAQDE
jgi:hypothetical protein